MIREVIERMMTIEGLTKPEEQPEVNSDKVMEAKWRQRQSKSLTSLLKKLLKK